jgi:hypothetical protein
MEDCGRNATFATLSPRCTLSVLEDGAGRVVGAAMTTIQAVFFGIMLAWTPSLVLVAFLLWRDGIGLRRVDAGLAFDDEPPYPNTR